MTRRDTGGLYQGLTPTLSARTIKTLCAPGSSRRCASQGNAKCVPATSLVTARKPDLLHGKPVHRGRGVLDRGDWRVCTEHLTATFKHKICRGHRLVENIEGAQPLSVCFCAMIEVGACLIAISMGRFCIFFWGGDVIKHILGHHFCVICNYA